MSAAGLQALACPAAWSEAAADLTGRVVLVVGASGGLGSAFARRAAASGAEVVLAGRRVAALERVYDDIVAAGGRAALYPLSLSGANPDDYRAMADAIAEQCGGIDAVVVVSAHHRGLGSVVNADPLEWLEGLHVNLTAPFLLAQACLPQLQQRADPAIVFAINGPDTAGKAYWGSYGVAQAGLAQFAAILADELASTPIRVHGFDPGPMRTGLRQRVWFTEDPASIPTPDRAAVALANLVGAAGGEFRSRLLRVD